jgi:hypothetical protein
MLRVQTVQWLGNGSGSDRLIPTLFALDVGYTLVLVFPEDSAAPNASARSVLWRNSGASPAGTRDPQDASNHKSATGGVIALQSGGFTVNNDTGLSPNVNGNESSKKYTAVVLNDPNGSEMRTGQFVGNDSTQTIATGLTSLSDVWIVGGGGGALGTGTAYRSNLFTGNASVPFGNGVQITNQITGFTGGSFSVGYVAVSGGINGAPGVHGGGCLYEWVAFNLAAGNRKVQHFYQAGTAASTITINFTGLANAIQVVLGRTVNIATTTNWRGPDQTGTACFTWDGPGTANPAGGFEAKNAASIVVGHDVAPNGVAGAGLVFPGTAGIPPEFTSISPAVGTAAGGTDVTITGKYFFDGVVVNFDGIAATDVMVVSDTEITCKTPAHASGLSDVTITNEDFQFVTAADAFTFTGEITSVSPDHGTMVGGTPVTIAGAGFIDGSTITFGGEPATDVVFVDVNTFTCVTPAHAVGAVDVVITEP